MHFLYVWPVFLENIEDKPFSSEKFLLQTLESLLFVPVKFLLLLKNGNV